ncbi:MAG: DUF554 domain-containing protein [Armatimonadetes bacterium]|nr:DUF554 domain-containing protein [Armatimonadota bacterium]
MIGTLMNVGTVVAGTLLGRALGSRLPKPVQETVMHGIGIITMVIGLQMALKTGDVLILLGSLLIGGILGEMARLDVAINALGDSLQHRFATEGDESFSKAFVLTSILFCVGPMTILGCIQDGLTGNYKTLAVKSVLDGFSSMAFAAALGWGVMVSAGTVLVAQGGLTLFAGVFQPIFDNPLCGKSMMAEMTAAGGTMLMALSLNLLELKRIRVASFLPGLLVAPLIVYLMFLWKGH